MLTDNVTDRIREFVVSLLPSYELELYDIQFRREGHGWVLRIIIDSHSGVTLDDCSRVSREVSVFLDVEDLIEHAYNLEVSSPGAERELRSSDECSRFIGERVRVKLFEELEGERVVIGELVEAASGEIVVITEQGKKISMPWEKIKKARLTLS
ncbi:MAG: ribosome maturation factor RimP [Desulfobulbaceae bacterium]|nr:MAG: ribosome maturation factor RimP [Desulfobulbaceae bacterium]